MVLAIERFPRGIAVLAGLWIALFAGWIAVRATGVRRVAAAVLMAAAVAGAVVALVVLGGLLLDLVVVAVFVFAAFLARTAFRVHVHLPAAARPERPVLFMNPWSGGGKARKFNLAEEAQSRGIRAVELQRGDDLWELVRTAIDDGADALAMAGGDGSQAIVAQLAAEHGLPYACIPAGTRNHFALDLGVDRNDVVGSLDAFVDGGERRVDLAEVNGRVFVNNVSIGLYANAVQQAGYRDEKIRTLFETASSELQSQDAGQALRWRGPEGEDGSDAVVLLISNNVYRLGAGIGSGTRPQLDEGVLGVAAALSDATGPRLAPTGMTLRQWSCRDFTIEAERPVPAGVDGEAMTLDPPIRFVSKPDALVVRIAPAHPGASPSTEVPRGLGGTVVKLARIAVGRTREAAKELESATGSSGDGHVRDRVT